MRLRTRFALVSTGIIIFLIVTPILVLFAGGFKVDWKNRQIIKTGTLVIKSEPDEAEIFIDDEEYANVTSANIRFLLPKDYNVRVEKDGYQSWTKRLNVRQQLVTWANLDRDFITLFLKTPQQISDRKIQSASASADHKHIVFAQDNKLFSLDFSGQRELGNSTEVPVRFNFPNHMAWRDAGETFDYFSRFTSVPFPNIVFSKLAFGGGYSVGLSGSRLHKITPSGNPLELISVNTRTFLLEDEDLWFIEGSQLKHHNLRTNNQIIIRSDITQSTTAEIIRAEGYMFILLDQALYSLNDHLEKIYDGVTWINWDEQSDQLVFSNNNEVLIYKAREKTSELILRSISQITRPILNHETGYIFFINENKIKAVEIDGRDHRNIYTIVELDSGIIPDYILSEDGKEILVWTNDFINTYRIR